MDPALAIEVAALSRAEAVNSAMSRGDSDIQRFYKNSVVFLTGGSGFLGKQLTEKLLRCCSVSKIYLLLRPKKGKQVEERLNTLVEEPVFDSLRKLKPEFASKIVPVAGDVADIQLGIDDDAWRTLTEEVNVIFHIAATIKFSETLQRATLINLRGTREIISLGKACKNLKSYVHVSTAYAHAMASPEEYVFENFGKSPIAPETLITLAESLEDRRLVDMTPGLIMEWPNTYSFTKAVAEELLKETSEGMPICIVRPGTVMGTYSEPSPGWTDFSNVNGAGSFLFGVGLGLMHTALASPENVLDFIPCDMVNNAIIAAGREAASSHVRGGSDTRIYHLSTTNRKPLKWHEMAELFEAVGKKIPSPTSVYYSFAYDTSSKLLFTLLSLIFHIIPACIADFISLIMGKKIKYTKIAINVYKKCVILAFFLFRQRIFIDDNTASLYQGLSDTDKIIFNFDVTSLDYPECVSAWCIGTRKYIVKDGLQGTEYALKKQKILKIVHYIVMCIYVYFLWKLISLAFYFITILFVVVAKFVKTVEASLEIVSGLVLFLI